MITRVFKWLLWLVALGALIWGVTTLEAERSAIPRETVETPAGEVTLYGRRADPLVVISHGFAGSTQMMQVITYDLVRAGFAVAAFDYAGHGRSTALLSRDVSRIEGTTEQLIRQTVSVVEALGPERPIALLGHSMATDIIIRAAERLDGVGALVAISMYSDAVTAEAPARLLILSGEWEPRLREVALEKLRLIDPEAEEGSTAARGDLLRRVAVAPDVEHVGVLYSSKTLEEARRWLATPLNHAPRGMAQSNGLLILLVLASLVVLSAPVARILPQRDTPAPLALKPFLLALLGPVLPAMAASWGAGGALLGMAAFGYLLVFFAVWGVLTLAALWAFGVRPRVPSVTGIILLCAICSTFALALDRYGAAFVPTGPRMLLMVVLLAGTLPFMLADRFLLAGASLWRRVVARSLPVLALLTLMLVQPDEYGLLFTVLPVMVLFYVVFGTMGRMVAKRAGPETAGIALSLVLAWSIAASQPLFAAL